MTRYLLDSNAVNDLVNGRASHVGRAEAARRRGHRIGTCEPVVAELRYGLELSASRDANMARLERGLKLLRCWPFDRPAAHEYGRIAADLRRRGRPMQVIDVMIAAVALSIGRCVVVTTDSDLSAVPGLSVEDWTTPSEAT
jgi:tRNA(fMet)-specific endonuclease VapC